MRDVDRPVYRSFRRERQLEERVNDSPDGEYRCRDGDERVQKNGAVLIVGADRRNMRGPTWMRVIGPVCMDQATVVMRRRVVVRVSVNEGRAYGGSLNSQRHKDGECLPDHHVDIVREDGYDVKGLYHDRCTGPSMRGACRPSRTGRGFTDHSGTTASTY
jgi:hypothetical protein